MMKKDLLLELGVEELPSAAVLQLSEALHTSFAHALKEENLIYKNIQKFATPRRLALLIHDLDEKTPQKVIERKGPAVSVHDKSSPAVIGFAKSCNVNVDDLTTINTEKGEWWYYKANGGAIPTKELLPTIITNVIKSLPIAKSMRWGNGDEEFVRPLHWAVLLFGQDVINMKILGVNTDKFSYGHRFHHPEALEITAPQHYENLLHAAFVVADFNKRKELIVNNTKKISHTKNLIPIMPAKLIDEVCSIVEWPTSILAGFSPEFLTVPANALIAAITSHQKCFPMQDDKENLQPFFITVSNIESKDPQSVIKGNESVMKARLSDAAFFYEQDKKHPLSSYTEATKRVIFQEKLGTIYDKILRLQSLIKELLIPLSLNETKAMHALNLSKNDLLTGMVGEFPELQGFMGMQYAKDSGEDNDIALALYEQYLPRFAEDKLPESNLGRALSLVDRIDTLVGIFAIGKKPTGMKDPFKLRRHALAVVRLLIDIPEKINLSTLIKKSFESFIDNQDGSNDKQKFANRKTAQLGVSELEGFILDRMPAFYQQQGIDASLVNAVKVCESDWLFDMNRRIQALNKFKDNKEADVLSKACKRVDNIIQQAKQKEEYLPLSTKVLEKNLQEPAEINLFIKVQEVEKNIQQYLTKGEYQVILAELATLRAPLDDFFDNVMVFVENNDLARNRLNLLANVQALLQSVADISFLKFAI